MTYRVSKQSNGLWTIHDISIFAKCKRGNVDYDEAWMDAAVANANVTERYGYCPPIFVKHNSFDKLDATRDEDADGRISSLRRQPVRESGTLKPGIVADLKDLSEDTAARICKHKLNGRSIETLYPSTRKSIDGLALLGRTKPFFELAQGSEPVKANFSAIDRDGTQGQLVFQILDDEHTETFNMIPPAPGGAPAPAPQAPAPGGAPGGVDPLLMQIFQLLQAKLGGGGAPAPAPAPSAPAPGGPPPAARMQASDLELLQAKYDMLNAQFKAVSDQAGQANAAAEQNAEAIAEAKKEAEIIGLFKELDEGGKVYTPDVVRDKVERFGLAAYREHFLPLHIAAPVGAPPSQRAPVTSSQPANFAAAAANDPDLQSFSALSPELQRVAAESAAVYDAECLKSRVFSQENPRSAWIAADVSDARRKAN